MFNDLSVKVLPKWSGAGPGLAAQPFAGTTEGAKPTRAVRPVQIDQHIEPFFAQVADHSQILCQGRMLGKTRITPYTIHPWHTFQQRGDVFLDGKVQLCPRIALPDQPQGGQGVDRVPEKAQVEHHDLFGAVRSFEETALR